MNIHKTLVFGLSAVLLFVLSASGVQASQIPAVPYAGVNTIGTVWQEQYAFGTGTLWGQTYNDFLIAGYPGTAGTYGVYNYALPARTGGFFGDTTAFLHGLRPGVYAPVSAHLTSYSQPVCNWPYCYTGGAGFRRPLKGLRPIAVHPGA